MKSYSAIDRGGISDLVESRAWVLKVEQPTVQAYFHALLFTSLSDMDCNLPPWDYYLPVNVHVCICCQVRESMSACFGLAAGAGRTCFCVCD